MQDKLLNWAVELQSLAQAGLFYYKDKFDEERFNRIREISAEMIACKNGIPVERVKDLFCNETGYQTPKIATRAAIFKDDKILLACENNGRWVMPGGWCDVDQSPAENAIKEVKEEAGLDVAIDKIIAVQDRAKHNLPKYVYGVTIIFYQCSVNGGEFVPNIETIATDYFSENNLPPLAEEKCTPEQIKMCMKMNCAINTDFMSLTRQIWKLTASGCAMALVFVMILLIQNVWQQF